MKSSIDVAVIGAGPYGLSAVAHLRTIPGLQVRAFGEAMSFWEKNMPAGMFLRSPWSASHIADPKGELTLDAYVAERGNHLSQPIPLDRFVDYGRWFQRKAAPDLDPRRIRLVQPAANGFELTAQDGEKIAARRVVVAAGIDKFARRPSEFAGLPESLLTHSCDHSDLSRFARQRVFVVGGGQSALESAALLHESGAKVEVIMRRPNLRWLKWRANILRVKLLGQILYSPRDVGPAGISQLVARPDLLRMLPRKMQDRIGQRSIKPAGAVWLQRRLQDVKVRTGCRVQSAASQANQVRLKLSDGTEAQADHLLLATGYRIDITQYGFLPRELTSRIDTVDGYPRLRPGLESSVPGLFFMGAPAAWSFGPVARFVSGTYYCAAALTRRIARSS